MRLGMVITRASSLDATWTTVALIHAALQLGHDVRVIERSDLEVDAGGRVVARAHAFEPPACSAERLAEDLRKRFARRCFVDVERLDVLLLRSAPLSSDLLTFAQIAKDRGVRVVNDPDGLARVSNKGWLASLPDVPTPATLVTRSVGAAAVFYRSQRSGVVIKPPRGSGGRDVVRVPAGQSATFEKVFSACRRAEAHVVVQAYLPAAERGEKRLLWLDGEILGGYLRTRAPGEFRHNLKRGAQASPIEVTEAERILLQPLRRHLTTIGIRFAGLDLIGEHLVEVNAVNPGGTFHTDRLTGSTHATTVISTLTQGPTPRCSTEVRSWALPEP